MMSSKHFQNDPAQLVASALRSLERVNPAVSVNQKEKIVYLKQTKNPQVSVISGGGSGHEPSFAGFVGDGFLSGAIAGSIFASPSTEQIEKCLMQHVDRSKGIMIIVMNYTGDVLHFGMAVEKAKARGVSVDMLVVGDDVGVGRARGGRIGRRGIAGTVLVQKIASASAAAGASLDEVARVAGIIASNLVSVGASLAHVHVPGRAPAADYFNASDEIELGMGIHNEEGFKRMGTGLLTLVRAMLAQLLDLSDTDRGYIDIKASDSVVLLVNNLGGVSVIELGCIVDEVCAQMQATYSIQPVRILVGTFMSSLNGQGFSVSLLKVVDTKLEMGKSILQLLDAPVKATGWPAGAIQTTWTPKSEEDYESDEVVENHDQPSNLTLNVDIATKVLKSGLQQLIAAEPDITKYDTMVGDGDCGFCLKGGAEALLAHIAKGGLSKDAVRTVSKIAQIVEANMDGTSGALYAIFLNSLASSLSIQSTSTKRQVTAETWAHALQLALKSLGKYTPAQPGDRTLVDALHPFVQTMSETAEFSKAVVSAKIGCDQTKGMEASLGRSVYVGGDDWKKCPDPGAYGVVELLLGMRAAL